MLKKNTKDFKKELSILINDLDDISYYLSIWAKNQNIKDDNFEYFLEKIINIKKSLHNIKNDNM